jgi:glucose-1-phosphate adenylyltransferase
MTNVLTIILGGGAGTRLFPLTRDRAKPAVPLAGKYRLIDVAISNCINSNFKKIFVMTQYLSASLNRHVSQSYAFDQFEDGFVDILAAEQRAEDSSWFQGTADAVRKHWGTLDNFDCDKILILPGDALYRMNFSALFKHHEESGAEITIGVNVTDQKHAHHFGLLAMDDNAQVVSFKEKPKTREEQAGLEAPAAILKNFGVSPKGGDAFLASMGIYLINRDVLHRYMLETDYMDFGKQIIPDAIKAHKVFGFVHDGYWEDIGTIEAFYRSHMDFLQDNPPFRFADPAAPIFTRQRFLPVTRFSGGTLDQSVVADGCSIGRAIIRQCVVGLRTVIGDHSTVEQSIVMGADHYDPAPLPPRAKRDATVPPLGIGKYCHIRRAIIDKNARIGNNVKILNERNIENADADNYYIREGLVIVPKNAVIREGTVI